MLVAVVTMNIKQGKCEDNFSFMESTIKQAIRDHADMIVFPQNAISGYLLGDRWLEDAWCTYVDSFNEKIIALSDEIAIVWGNIKYRNQRRFNASFFAYQGKTHMRVKKNEQHAYMRDEMYFEDNDINGIIEFQNLILALNFHEEIQLTDLNINIDACPYDMDEKPMIRGNTIYANAVGVQNAGKNIMVMQGGSCVRTQRKTIYQAEYFSEAYALVDLKSEQIAKEQQPHVVDALVCGIRHFDEQVFGAKVPWIVGLSGGLDSSVTSALLSYSLGNERVYGFNMATQHNSSTTKQYAAQEAAALGIHYKEGSIQSLVDASKDVFMKEYGFDAEAKSSLVMENIQARARGYLLGGFAGILGGVIVNNANKVESMLGYCTLYGDSVGAFSPIGDLTKVQLFEIAKELNKRFGKEVIPVGLLPVIERDAMHWEMAPSAELKEHQFDPMKWFYHDYLADHLGKDLDVITLMKQYLHNELQQGEIARWISFYGLEKPNAFLEDLDWFVRTMDKNAFKRLQLPPLLCLHKQTLADKVESQMQYDKQMYAKIKEEISKM